MEFVGIICTHTDSDQVREIHFSAKNFKDAKIIAWNLVEEDEDVIDVLTKEEYLNEFEDTHEINYVEKDCNE